MSNFIFTNQFYNDKDGRTLPKARLYFYDNNTFNFTDVYSDPELTQVLDNPVVADGAGRFPQIFIDTSKVYRVWLKDRNDKQVTPYIDDYTPLIVAADVNGVSVDTLQIAIASDFKVGRIVNTTGYHSANDGGAAQYIVVPGGTGTDDGGSYLDMNNGNQLELIHDWEIKAAWFGVKGNCTLLNSSSDTPNGDDDTNRILALRQYVQNISVFNYARGLSNEYTMSFSSKMKIRVVGDNVLGTTLPRLTSSSTGAEKLIRCNYNINGNGCLFYWDAQNQEDRFIESHETLVKQRYSNFTVVQSDMQIGDITGILYSNIANTNANACTWHKFENVRLDLAGTGYVAATGTGYYRVFQYFGNNLGDKLVTDFCQFRYFKTGFYSENLEAVGQRITKTGFYAYMDDVIFFHMINHGSSFTVENCDLLLKGENQTLLKIDKQNQDGVFGASAIYNFNNNRTETSGGKTCTFVYANSGVVNYSGGISTAGGLPNPESVLFYAHTNAVINVKSCVIAGRVATGDYSDSLLTISRNYGIKLTECQFIVDPAESIGIYDGITFTESYDIASSDIITKPLIIERSNTNTCNWQNGVGSEVKKIIDFTYNSYGNDHFTDSKSNITLYSFRGSSGFRYPQVKLGEQLVVLPAACVVESIDISYFNLFPTIDELTINIGSAIHVITVDAASNYRNSVNIMPNDIIVCPSNIESEREVYVTGKKGGVDVNVTYRGLFVFGLRPCESYLDNTTSSPNSASFKMLKTRT